MKWLIGCGSLVGLGFVAFAIAVVLVIGTLNKEVSLRNQATAKQEANAAVFDNVWKTIAQVAQVNDEYKADFGKVWKDILGAQSGGGRVATVNVFMNRINPKFDSSLSKKVMQVVESSRKEFTNNQKELIDIKREHDNLRTKIPSKFLLAWFGNSSELHITIVTSGRTQDSFESGKDDNIDLRPKTEQPKVEPAK